MVGLDGRGKWCGTDEGDDAAARGERFNEAGKIQEVPHADAWKKSDVRDLSP